MQARNTAGFLSACAIDAGGLREWEIENIVIAAHARRRGLGTKLLDEFLDSACGEGAATIFLEVRESNCAARSFYEKFRFVEDGRRRCYYREPEEDAILYRLNLR